MENFLLKALEKTDGWVLVVLWLSYLAYRIYMDYSDKKALHESLAFIRNNITSLVNQILQRLDQIASSLE